MTEHDQQVAFFKWVRLKRAAVPRLKSVWATPNGGKRDARVGAAMTLEGVEKGVFDITVALAEQGFHGLFIEMKNGQNTLSPEQKAFQERQTREGYLCRVCYSAQEAIECLKSYLRI